MIGLHIHDHLETVLCVAYTICKDPTSLDICQFHIYFHPIESPTSDTGSRCRGCARQNGDDGKACNEIDKTGVGHPHHCCSPLEVFAYYITGKWSTTVVSVYT